MGKYQPPKRQLHRDFVYLDHDSVLNSLSAFEAGRIDEIIEKTTDATDKAAEGGLKVGPVKGGASRKRESQIQEELVRKRTQFSAFEGWYRQLTNEEALGRFDEWDTPQSSSARSPFFVELSIGHPPTAVPSAGLTPRRIVTLPCADSAGRGVHEGGFEMTRQQLRRQTDGRIATKGTGRFVVAARLELGNRGWRVCSG